MMKVVDLSDEYMEFVVSCTHTDEERDEEARRVYEIRERWIRKSIARGAKVKVVVENGTPVGFAHCAPIELGAWGMTGEDLLTVPCLTLGYQRVYAEERGSGRGRALMEAVEQEAKAQGKKGVAVEAFDHDFWFMPAAFFRRLGYEEVARRSGTVLMLKAFEPVDPPEIHKLNYHFRPVPGKVVVDIFWTPICPVSIGEILTVREVCAEFGDDVVLNEYNSGEKEIIERFQASRALFINGEGSEWGYMATREGLKEKIEEALRGLEDGEEEVEEPM